MVDYAVRGQKISCDEFFIRHGGLFKPDPRPPPIPVYQVSHINCLYDMFAQDLPRSLTSTRGLGRNRAEAGGGPLTTLPTRPSPLLRADGPFRSVYFAESLHFGLVELFSERIESYTYVCWRNTEPKKADLTAKGLIATPKTLNESVWRDVCTSYSRTGLTFPEKDTFQALAGLPRQFG